MKESKFIIFHGYGGERFCGWAGRREHPEEK